MYFQSWQWRILRLLSSGASLVSIEDPQEALFIQNNLELLQDGAKTFWIGLYKSHEGEYPWFAKVTISLDAVLFVFPACEEVKLALKYQVKFKVLNV